MARESTLRGIGFLLVVVLGFAWVAADASADPLNTRPVTLGNSSDGTDKDLVDLFGAVSGVGAMTDPFNPLTEQSPVALWTPGAGGTTTTVVLEIAGYSGNNAVGIYSAGTPSQTVQLFSGSATTGTALALTFEAGSLKIGALDQGSFDLSQGFGFYIDANGNSANRYYTEDSRNGGVAQALVFQGQGGSQDIERNAGATLSLGTMDWVIAFEDLPYGSSDKDFNDFVFVVQNIEAVPEPATLALLGLALGAGGMTRRRWRKRA